MASAQKMDKRAKNFNQEDINILLTLIQKHKPIIDSRQTDSTTSSRKRTIWLLIERDYNRLSKTKRTATVLRTKYKNIKKEIKRANNSQDINFKHVFDLTHGYTHENSVDERLQNISKEIKDEIDIEEIHYIDQSADQTQDYESEESCFETNTGLNAEQPAAKQIKLDLNHKKHSIKSNLQKLAQIKCKLTETKLKREIEILNIEHERKMQLMEQEHELKMQKFRLEIEILQKNTK